MASLPKVRDGGGVFFEALFCKHALAVVDNHAGRASNAWIEILQFLRRFELIDKSKMTELEKIADPWTEKVLYEKVLPIFTPNVMSRPLLARQVREEVCQYWDAVVRIKTVAVSNDLKERCLYTGRMLGMTLDMAM